MDFILHGVVKSQTGLSDFHFQVYFLKSECLSGTSYSKRFKFPSKKAIWSPILLSNINHFLRQDWPLRSTKQCLGLKSFCVCVVGQPAAVFIFFLSSHLGITNLLSLCFFYPKKSPRFILLIELFLTLDCIYSICMQISFVFCLMIFT